VHKKEDDEAETEDVELAEAAKENMMLANMTQNVKNLE